MELDHCADRWPAELPLKRWAKGIFFGNLAFILLATLSPFDFSFTNLSLARASQDFFAYRFDIQDMVANVILFIPYGVGLTCMLLGRGVRRWLAGLIALLASTGLSLNVELLQIFLPSRFPSWIDVMTNSSGGFLGALSYLIFCDFTAGRFAPIAQSLRQKISVKSLTIFLVVWLALAGLIGWMLKEGAQMNNWDLTFPLVLGNEHTGDRPWRGTVSDLAIYDRAISQAQAADLFQQKNSFPANTWSAQYSLTGADGYRSHSGDLPELRWQGSSPPPSAATGSVLSEKHWLDTGTAATQLSEKLRRSLEFTLTVVAAADNSQQIGPARIVSLSADPGHRNFTLGQEKDQLVFRLRTPVTGKNGAYTALFVPDIFSNQQPHRVIITYQKNVLRAYIDRPENVHSLVLTPEITLFRFLFPSEGRLLRLNRFSNFTYHILFYSIFFIPIGVTLALLQILKKGTGKIYPVFAGLGIILPAVLLQVLLRGQLAHPENIVLSITIVVATLLLVRFRATRWLRSSPRSLP